jgi:DNA-directed RNA polymerase II subunit RPB2
MEQLVGDSAKELAEHLINRYFRTQAYPYTRHHIESYDQFLSQDLPAIIAARNPIQLLQSQIGTSGVYAYRAEIFIGGLKGESLYIGTPSVSLKDSEEIRLLYPNEARLRNLTYSALVEADIVIRLTFAVPQSSGPPLMKEVIMDPVANPAVYGYLARFPLFRIPIMLHSRYCILHSKPQSFLREAGECVYDYGGYFIVEGSEKVLITHQEQAFNTLYVTPQDRDPKLSIYATISCLNPTTRQVKRVAFGLARREGTLAVSLPFVRKPVPVFLLFRAMGIQADEDILRLILPNPDSAETKILEPLLHESIVDSFPFLDTFSAIQYIKVLTKGFSEAHVLDILHNQTFIHVEDRPGARIAFLAECVRKILRVAAGIDPRTDRDDTRNQRCLTSGVLTRMLFQGVYSTWAKAMLLTIDKEYKNNVSIYQDSNFGNLFLQGTLNQYFMAGQITEGIQRAFKGKWSSGSGAGVGEEKTGVIQPLSRLSYIDFLSHCRRVVLDFDTGMKLPGPRRLHTSQYGYFCTAETPGGASIGISKNLSILAAISTATDPAPFVQWLLNKGGVMTCDQMTPSMVSVSVPVFINNGIVGYTMRPILLRDVLKAMKWTGCLPASTSVGFSIRDRRVFVFLDEGRPMRPLIHLGPQGSIPVVALRKANTWRDLVLGVLPQTLKRTVHQTGFVDPMEGSTPSLEDYLKNLMPNTGVIEYVDPYEMNEAYIANFPEYIQPETSHMEIHPSTIVGAINAMIPYAHHNQSPRNQLGCSQAKQGIALYATNFQNRFDNRADVLCYSQAPIVRTIYYDYMADGQMGYGQNMILAIGSFTGYNQDDGIVMNADSFARGMFRSTCYRTYELFEEDDMGAKTRIGNPVSIPGWTSLKPGIDYSKLDNRGIVRVGELVDENTVLIGAYLQGQGGEMRDASRTAQVWTHGRVDKVVVTTNNAGLAMVKVRVVQERVPELGDKFCLTPDHDALTEYGWVPIADIIPSMKVAQLGADGGQEFVWPETHSFDHQGDVYEFATEGGGFSQMVTDNHRMYVADSYGKRVIILAKDLFLSDEVYWFVTDVDTVPIFKKEKHLYSGPVYCLSVPSTIFLVRNRKSRGASWTGNSNRHGQKGTIGMFVRSYDMPRTREGIPVDMIMNPHAIPSRMTIAQMIETLVGKAAGPLGAIGNGTLFMNDGNPAEAIGKVLRDTLGMEPHGDELMYDGMSGQFIPTQVFVGNVYGMRLKHLVEDKWNARGAGRREQRTHQPTGGRGNQGGLRIGEMERDAIVAHGVSGFLQESMMKRADGYETYYCNGCGTIPIYNEKDKLFICPMCDGPVQFVGDNASNLDILPPVKRSLTTFSKVEIPYALKLLDHELATYLNMGIRMLTAKDVTGLKEPPLEDLTADQQRELMSAALPERVLLDTTVPELIPESEEAVASLEDLAALGSVEEGTGPEEVEDIEALTALNTARNSENTTRNSENMGQGEEQPQNANPTVYLGSMSSGPLQEDDASDIPFANESQPRNQGSVSVQTSNQPFLVVPVNVAQPTEFIPPAVPGAPPTIAVDTSNSTMRNIGLSGPSTPQNTRSRGNSRSSSPGNGTVNVSKMGSSSGPVDSGARVLVTKQG